MPIKSMRDAINDALHLEMARDPSIIVLGEDVSGGAGGTSGEREASGGIFGVTKGLLPRFGDHREMGVSMTTGSSIRPFPKAPSSARLAVQRSRACVPLRN